MSGNDVLCSTVLYCTVLYCTVLYCTVLYCTVLYLLHCNVQYFTVLYCKIILQDVKLQFINAGNVHTGTCTAKSASITVAL